jgi:hypothetical protein
MWAGGLFFEFETSLTVDGEDVHIRRLIECVGYGPGLGQALGFKRPRYSGIKQYATPQSVGQRLAAGGAVMLVVDDVCYGLDRWASDTPGAREGTIAYPLPDDYLQLIAWTPTPDDPEMIEAYVTRSYYERPDARVRLRDLTIRLARPNSDARKEDEFAWFYPASDEYPPEKYGRASYFGLYMVPISQTEWSESEEIARLLRSIDRPSIVAWGESERALQQSDRIPKPFTPWGTTSGTPSRQLLRPEILGVKGQEVEYRQRIVPLRWDGKAFVMSPADRGAVVLYRTPAWANPDGAPLRVRFRDVVLVKERPYGPRGPRLGLTHLFDPIEGILHGFGAVYVHTKP